MCTVTAKAGECGTRCKIRGEDDKQSPEPSNQTRKQKPQKPRTRESYTESQSGNTPGNR